MPMLKPEKRGDSWRVRVYIGDKRYKSVTAATRAEAIRKAEELQMRLNAAPHEDDPYGGLSVAEAMERYIDAKRGVLSPSTLREYVRLARTAFESLHEVRLRDLTQEQIQIAVGVESATHEPKTVRNMHGLLSSTLKMFRPGFTIHTKLPQKKKTEIVIPTEEDVLALLRAVESTDIDVPVYLAALCGLRMSEILGLRWSEIDFCKKEIRIKTAKVKGEDGELVLKGTKTIAGERTIKMLPAVEASLRRAFRPDVEFVTDLTAAAIKGQYLRKAEKVCKQKFSFHALRHYCASVMIMLGIPVKYIADYLGHETEDMVNRVYGHIMADKKDELFARLEDYYNARLPKSCPRK